jgi:hypothetical protein
VLTNRALHSSQGTSAQPTTHTDDTIEQSARRRAEAFVSRHKQTSDVKLEDQSIAPVQPSRPITTSTPHLTLQRSMSERRSNISGVHDKHLGVKRGASKRSCSASDTSLSEEVLRRYRSDLVSGVS